MLKNGILVPLFAGLVLLISCNSQRSEHPTGNFTDIDSLTDTYLTLEDTILSVWNEIERDETEKIKAMRSLIASLMDKDGAPKNELDLLEARLDQLEEMWFSPKSMEDTHLVDAYDFASNSLVTEITTLAESNADYAANDVMQEQVNRIRIADQHIEIYRADYDSVTTKFNELLEKYSNKLDRLDDGLSREKKPLF